jgi:pyridoxine 4-dehydrogenase
MRFVQIVIAAFLGASTTAFAPQRVHKDRSLELHSRRDFLNNAAAASASLVVSSACCGLVGLPSDAFAATTPPVLDLPEMGLGAWAWGDSLFWGYNSKEDEELHRVFDYAVQSNKSSKKVLFDTAELYGLGRSETLLGEFSKDYPDKVTIASKFAPIPFYTKGASDVVKHCEDSVKRLGRPIDLYQIHFPNAWSNTDYWDGLAQCYEKGLVKAVGVSNYGVEAMTACHAALAKRGIPLATNQIQYSLLYTWPEQNGLLQACKDLNVQVLAYSPLALGMLTGKYNKDKMPRGPRKSILEDLLKTPDYQNLLLAMGTVAANHPGSTLSQVAINWTRAKGTIPIPGARTIPQVKQNYGALEWAMSREEIQVLDDAAKKVTTFLTPDKSPMVKEDINTHMRMMDS